MPYAGQVSSHLLTTSYKAKPNVTRPSLSLRREGGGVGSGNNKGPYPNGGVVKTAH